MLDRVLVAVPFWRRGAKDGPELKERVSPVAAVAECRQVTAAWRLSDHEARQLFGISRVVHRQMKHGRNAILARDQSARISLLSEIYKSLQVLYGKRRADGWVRSPNPNPLFGGERPLDYMLQGGIDAVLKVRNLVGCWSGYASRR